MYLCTYGILFIICKVELVVLNEFKCIYIFCDTKVIAFCRNIFRRITTIWFWYIFILVCLSHALPSCGHQIRIYGQILKSKAYSAPCRFVTLFPFERESYSWTHTLHFLINIKGVNTWCHSISVTFKFWCWVFRPIITL